MRTSMDYGVLSLESRRAREIEKLIRTYGGEPIVVPAMREVGLESNTQVIDFARDLIAGSSISSSL